MLIHTQFKFIYKFTTKASSSWCWDEEEEKTTVDRKDKKLSFEKSLQKTLRP